MSTKRDVRAARRQSTEERRRQAWEAHADRMAKDLETLRRPPDLTDLRFRPEELQLPFDDE